MTRIERVIPVLVVLVCGGWYVSKAVPPAPPSSGVDYAAIGRIPVRDGGRVMPLETVARSTLQALSGRSEVLNQDGSLHASAVQWLVGIMDHQFGSGRAADMRVFRIDSDQLLGTLELERRPGSYRYSLKEIFAGNRFAILGDQIARVDQKKRDLKENKPGARPLDLYDTKVQELSRKLERYQDLALGKSPQVVPPQGSIGWMSFEQLDSLHVPDPAEQKAAEAEAEGRIQPDLNPLIDKYGDLEHIPPIYIAPIRRDYKTYTKQQLALIARDKRGLISPAAAALTRVLGLARIGDGSACTAALAEYETKYLGGISRDDRTNVELEARVLDEMAPFYHAIYLYLFVLLLAAFGWLGWSGPLLRSALYLGLFALGAHTAGLIVRMYVQGRPPVTNLYASAVFIGWGAAGLSLLLEWFYRNGLGSFLAGTCGAATLYVAHFLSGSGDTMPMLQAVLDTNFWLATHVTTVTLGYTATLVAGVIAILYILGGVFTPALTKQMDKQLGQMIYGVVCFATLLSFVGTVLGGLWADYSWGRFWGWDPKENGAVMIVIWNCLILHARWGGIVRNQGVAVLAVIGNIVTVWSWFGTNQLGIGLHAYGFDNKLASGCRDFWLSQLAIIAIGLVPHRHWRTVWHHVGIGPALVQFFTFSDPVATPAVTRVRPAPRSASGR